MKNYIYPIVIIGLFACSKSTTQSGRHDAKMSDIRLKPISEVSLSSIKPKENIDLKNIIGLYTGQFETDSIALNLRMRYREYDSIQSIQNEEYEYETVFDNFSKTLTSTEKKYIYKDPLFGTYWFKNGNAISVFIKKMVGDSVFGTSVCAGNERDLKGKIVNQNDTFKIELTEPGDDPYDGKFFLTLNAKSGKMKGQFIPMAKGRPIKKVTMQSSEFKYDPKAVEWSMDRDFFGKNISLERLVETDVENFSKHTLRVLRNLIYARHGYSFKMLDIRTFFESYSWYTPVSINIQNVLTEIEKDNIALIKRYEAYAEDYYDEFGR
ncbi:MAG: YARHG domain-containing protein [Flavobacteriales bacterium]|nr:YARHG domain-containing protein [Flavobacteriales bacterium]